MDLNLASLIEALTLSGSVERDEKQQGAEKKLNEWETAPNFHYLLQSIYLDLSIPLQTRWLSVILFKNGIEKYWRQSRKNSISKEEKTAIRKRLFDSIVEQNNQLAIQNAYTVAKICRFDFPTEWPNFFEDFESYLTRATQTNEVVSINNLLLILNQSIKLMATVRIGRTRAAMQLKIPSLMPMLFKLYLSFFESWTKDLDLVMMQLGYLCLKNLRRIIVDGYEYQNQDTNVVEFFQLSVTHYKLLLVEYDRNKLDILAKYLKCFNKLYLNLINVNPSSFILIPSSLEILNVLLSVLDSRLSIIYNSEDDEFWQQFAIQVILILKKLLSFSQKKGALTMKRRSDKEDLENSIDILRNNIFMESNVEILVSLLINWYLKLQPLDLESWNVEPEEWVNEQATLSWEFQLRPCSENFFQDLTESFPELLSNLVLGQISQKYTETLDILTKDSIMAAFQLSSLSISSLVNCDQLLVETFIPEALKSDSMERKILKRRILLIIQEWISTNFSASSRLEIYKLYLNFLNSTNAVDDKVVKLTACQSLRISLEDWDFDKNAFQPFLHDFLNSIVRLLEELQLTETKSAILKLLSIIILQNTPLVPLTTLEELLAMVPRLWDYSNNYNDILMKQLLIRLLNNLVISLNDNSLKSYDIVTPLLSVCCDEKSEFFKLLSEDGFELWNSILIHFPIQFHELPVNLTSKMPIILDGFLNSTEILSTILSIIRGYALIDPTLFAIDSFGDKFMEISLNYLSQFRDDCFLMFLSILEILILKGKNDTFLNHMIEHGFLDKLLQYAFDEGNATTPNGNKTLGIISRMCYRDAKLVISLFKSQDMFANFLNSWTMRISANSEPRNKKISILGLLSIFKIAMQNLDDSVMSVFGNFIKIVTQFLEEYNEDLKGDCESYQMGFLFDEYNFSFDETQVHNGQWRRIVELYTVTDPVVNVPLKPRLREELMFLKLANEQEFNRLMTTYIDEPTLDQLKLIMS